MANFSWISAIKANLIMFKIVGLWPSGEKYKHDFYALYTVVSITLCLFAHSVFFTVEVLLLFRSDITVLIRTLFLALTQTLSFIKSCFFVKNLRKLKHLVVILESDLFQPQSSDQRHKIEPALRSCKRANRSFFSLVYFTLTLFLLLPVLTNTTKDYILPVQAWYPWYTEKSPAYEFTYLFQIVSTIFRGTTSISIDTFVTALNTYVATQCILLCDTLQNVRLEENSHETLKRSILHHKLILR